MLKKRKNSSSSIANHVNCLWTKQNVASVEDSVGPNNTKVKDAVNPMIFFCGKKWVLDKGIIGAGGFSHVRLAIPLDGKDKSYKELVENHELLAIKAFKSFRRKDHKQISIENCKLFYKLYRDSYPSNLQGIDDISDLLIEHKKKNGRTGLYFVMPCFPGSLREFIRSIDYKTEAGVKKALRAAVAVIDTVLNFHQKSQKIHCDIKAENFQYDPDKNIAALIDFDMSSFPDQSFKLCGTYNYMAPELCFQKRFYASDYYALAGVIGQILGVSLNDLTLDKKKYYDSNHDRITSLRKFTQTPYNFALLHQQLSCALDKDAIKKVILLLTKASENNVANRLSAFKELKAYLNTLLIADTLQYDDTDDDDFYTHLSL